MTDLPELSQHKTASTMPAKAENSQIDRRSVLKTSAAAVATASIAGIGPRAHAQGSDVIRIGLVGCGGRGTGAALDNLKANDNVKIVALGDVWEDKVKLSLESLKKVAQELGKPEEVDVKPENMFVGFDAAYKVINHPDVDLVIHATPPGFRPDHMMAAVNAGKHLFVEKPACVDPAGYRKCLEVGKIAREKKLGIVTGTLYRRTTHFSDVIEGIMKKGTLGDILCGECFYLVGPLKHYERQEGWTDMEFHSRNWWYQTYMSGDTLVEQAVHNLDVANWVFGGPPVKCVASGGRIQRTAEVYGNIYDHFSVTYEYANGQRVDFKSRQWSGSTQAVRNHFKGTLGHCDVSPDVSKAYLYEGNKRIYGKRGKADGYQNEHRDLVDSIRAGSPICEIEQMADSSLTGIMGRLAAYSGQLVKFSDAQKMDLDLWITQDGAPVNKDTPVLKEPVAVPGTYKLPR